MRKAIVSRLVTGLTVVIVYLLVTCCFGVLGVVLGVLTTAVGVILVLDATTSLDLLT